MLSSVKRWSLRSLVGVGLAIATIVLVRAVDSLRGPPLQLWHKVIPHELKAAELDRTDWAGYLAAEDGVFRTVEQEVTAKLPQADRVPGNRYFAGSPLHPARFATDWNRSFVLEPAGTPRGAVVLLHGLTDGPYSLRHVAELYRGEGFVAFGLRLPGHGTVPAALTEVSWRDWLAAARLAMREARRHAGPGTPLHLVGYSNGGAVAMKYALDALGDPALPRPDRIVLFSPMVGVTGFARFAGIAGWAAYVPAFAKAAWLSILPEFNPFKYNSFPVHAAVQSHALTQEVQGAVRARARDGVIEGLAPVLTFQSVLDSTVSTPAVLSALYAHLPRNGSEVVLFDVNRAAKLGPLLRPRAQVLADRILPAGPRTYRSIVVTNAGPDDAAAVVRVTEPGQTMASVLPLGLSYPRDVFSLSHVATPFPPEDGLYGTAPDPSDDFGIRLGTVAARGEQGSLVIDLDTLMRMSSNPFFPQVAERIRQGIRASR